MTVSTTTAFQSYTGNGATVAFAVPFYFLANSHIVVQLRKISDSSITAQSEGTNYTLVGALSLGGGTVTMAVAPPATHNLEILRTVPLTQPDDYISYSAFPAETMERSLDRLEMQIQQINDSVAALGQIGGGITMANIGASGVSSYAGSVGTQFQFKRIVGAGGIVATESASQITLTGAGSSTVDQTANYSWTGYHSFTKQAARTIPSVVLKSLQGAVDITDSNILLASDYVALLDLRKNTDVSVEAPVDGIWGGNFNIYAQHKTSGNANATFGTLVGGVRAQVETTAAKNGSPINDAVSFYGGIYNNGTDVGAFGFHLDAYHVGTSAGTGHSTIGVSAEVYKNIAGGTVAGFITRSQGTETADYGMAIVHAATFGAKSAFNRGVQLGNPTFANGGVQSGGFGGNLTKFNVGVDLTWADFDRSADTGGFFDRVAMQIKENDYLVLSGQAQAQSSAPIKVCRMRFDSATGMFAVRNNSTDRFDVNMTTGRWRQNGNDTWAAWDTGTTYVFACTSTNKTASTVGAAGGASALPATPTGYLRVNIAGLDKKIPYYDL